MKLRIPDKKNHNQAGIIHENASIEHWNPGRRCTNSTIYSPNGAELFSADAFRSESIFLTDGSATIYYKDLPAVVQAAHDLFESRIRSQNAGHSPAAVETGYIAGIETTNRFQSILWMTYCWANAIPFVPFSKSNFGPVELFRPDILITTSDESWSIPVNSETADSDQEISKLAPFINKPLALFCGLTTSGSSGRPKRVALLRKNMIAATRNSFRSVLPEKESIEHLWGHCLPLDHAGGLSMVFRALHSGTGIYLWNKFDASSILHSLNKHSAIKRISLVPTMLKRLLDHQQDSGITPLHALHQVLVGGGPANPELIRGARRSGWPVTFSYGMTETCGHIACQNVDGSSPDGSVGRPFPDHAIEIRDDSGKTVKPGFSGTLFIKGPQLFPGYLPELTSISDFANDHFDTTEDGWFDTGDYARMDLEGNLYIEARRTNLIVTGGKNVNPEEIESILKRCEYIIDAAVTWLPDEEWGQLVVAMVIPVTMDINVKQRIHTYVSKSLKAHQRPKKIGFADVLPRTSLGKLERKNLQNLAKDRFSQK